MISPENVGNLLKNGDFEQIERDGKTPAHWRGTNAQIISSEGLGLGLGKHVLKFADAKGGRHHGQSVKLRGGTTYLYTAWIWNQGMEGGSNINQTMKDGIEPRALQQPGDQHRRQHSLLAGFHLPVPGAGEPGRGRFCAGGARGRYGAL